VCAPKVHGQHQQTSSDVRLPIMLHRVEVLQQPEQAMSLWNTGSAHLLKSRDDPTLPMNEPSRSGRSSLDAGEFPRQPRLVHCNATIPAANPQRPPQTAVPHRTRGR
jgi:hypothetical protein